MDPAQGGARLRRARHDDRARHGRHAPRAIHSGGTFRARAVRHAPESTTWRARSRSRSRNPRVSPISRTHDQPCRPRALSVGVAERRPTGRAIAIGLAVDELETPGARPRSGVATANAALMGERMRQLPAALRPHVKAHKCVELARLQLEHGAIGVTTATVAEAEAMARCRCARRPDRERGGRRGRDRAPGHDRRDRCA